MPKEEWGVKRVCPTTGKRFYDLNRDPIVSPYTGEVVTLDTSKVRTIVADKADPASATEEEDDVVVDDDDDSTDVELDDDGVLDDDDDDDDVSLDELADVPSDSDDD